MTRSHLRHAANDSGASGKASRRRWRVHGQLAFLVIAALPGMAAEAPTPATAQPAAQAAPQPPASPKPAAPLTDITFVGGQLSIRVYNVSLRYVLGRVGALMGVNIDIPDGTDNEAIPRIQLGPGPARQIIASLLSDFNFDYLIQSADADEDKLQLVLIVPRAKKDGASALMEASAPAPHNTYVPPPDAPLKSEEAIALPPPPEKKPEASTSNPSGQSAQPEQTAELSVPQDVKPDAARPAALAPTAMTPQNMSQQLQQMYQQRMQMVQQSRQTGQQ